MHLLFAWTRRVVMIMVLTGAGASGAYAETRISTSNDPSGGLSGQMTALLGQEKAAIGALKAGRMEQILVAPTAKATAAKAQPAVRQAAARPVASVAGRVAEAAPAAPQNPVAEPAPVLALVKAGPAVVSTGQPVLGRPGTQQDENITLAATRPAEKAAEFRFFPELFGRGPAKPVSPVAKGPVQVRYDAGWLAALPAAKGDAQWECLAKALYFEARGESVSGQFAVGEVVLNRADSGMYPGSICGVVNQGSKYSCQFSFVCDGYSDKIHEWGAYQQAGKIAALLIAGAPRALTDGATHFHTGAVRPAWARRFPQTAKIGAHYFYRQPIRIASN